MNITPHLPALQVVIPLLSAPLAILMRRANTAFLVVTAASWAAFAIAISLWLDTADGTVISYAIGSWEPPWGIEYRCRYGSHYLALQSGQHRAGNSA
jgi:multicomponent Na+:H+ antiporter subunit D